VTEQSSRTLAGNVYDKYRSRNPVARRLVRGFSDALAELVDRARPASLLDVGCGEGVVTAALADRLRGRRVVGVDVEDPRLRREWSAHARPNLDYRVGDAMSLALADGEFDVACALEVLEHVSDPRLALGELRRVVRRGLIMSVPCEPVWRMANVARGAYLRSLGDTPGHLHHWSKRGFASLVSRYGRIDAVRSPFPWTIALLRFGGG
jgi:ubiquinone/menaquinone biosynthesis C-methylase UbiE